MADPETGMMNPHHLKKKVDALDKWLHRKVSDHGEASALVGAWFAWTFAISVRNDHMTENDALLRLEVFMQTVKDTLRSLLAVGPGDKKIQV